MVSLGWCFWHRGCFGCLVCATRLEVPATNAGRVCSDCETRGVDKKGEWGKWDGSGDELDTQKSSRCIGVELEEIPLCNVCKVETAGESSDRVLERGLESVTRFDGGMSRNRLDLMAEAKTPWQNRRATRTEDSLRSSLCREKCHKGEPLTGEDRSPLLENAADMGISDDGCIDDCSSHSDTEMCHLLSIQMSPDQEITHFVVYVSVLNPIGGSTLRPSKTKPLPGWMNLLPSNVHRERKRRAETVGETTRQSHEMKQIRESYTSDGSDDLDADTPVAGRVVTRTGNGRQQGTNPSMVEVPLIHKRLTVVFDPVPKGDTIEEVPFRSRSQTVDLNTSTDEGCSCSHPCRPQSPYPRSSYPSLSRLSITRNETNSCFSHRPCAAVVDLTSESCRALGSHPGPFGSSQMVSSSGEVLDTPETRIQFSSPSQSSEYLERYQPKRNSDAKYEKYVAGDAEPILKKIKRHKAVLKDNEEGSKKEDIDAKGKGKSLKLLDEEFGLDSRREHLNQELRNLFCEE